MYVYRIFISVVLLLVYCEVTVEQATHGPLLKICTTTWFNTKLMPTAPRLAEEDEDVINALLGCSKGILLPPSCSIGFTDAVTCDCYLENHKRCRVVRIDFSNRRLEGEIPEKIGNLQYLTSLYLNGNKLRGSIPGSFQHLKSLLYFSLCDNSLKGRIPTFLGQMPSLRSIYLCKNFFDQTIPPELGSLPSLEYLDLSYNFLSGKIPDQLGNIKSLLGLKNKLNQIIPAWMNDTPFVDVSENLIKFVNISPEKKLNPDLNLFKCCRETDEVTKRDQVDFDCKNGTQIYDRLYINCGGESVTVNGTEYEADIQPHGQSTFFKSKRSNWGYSSMGNFLWASGNKYILNDTCQIHAGDAQLYRTARLSSISLKYYGFCLKNGTYDVNLHFAEISGSENKDSHSKAGRLFDVDIQGENVLRNFNIETEAKDVDTAITKPFKANVNNSQLEIHLYWSGKGSVSYPSVYYGPLISAITVTPVRESELPRGVLAGISGFALFLLILFIGFWWRFEDKLRREELELVELYPGGLYNYKKIRAATKNFDIANRLCGGVSGTVYKGTLSDGIPVAVKKLSETKEGMREFAETSGTIAGIKHPNLVTLMGCCAGKNQLLLIYEYIGTTSLEDALFGSDDELRARLDWQTRCKICLGLAEGLSFLHEGSKLDIIHGDIKPENILLDDDLNPKIDNFGFARLYHKQKSEGTSSYTAPEVKDRPLEASADVYSFAVVMLVLFSGRKIKTPRAGAETVYLVDEAQIMNEKGILMELIDQNLNYDGHDAAVILTLAMKCINSPPSSRDTMSTIVEELKKLNSTLIKLEGD
ncbi:hypothetical protein T459_34237 [Capsicum annuum]|uniref:non-specific serine/threonine protein kinase n=1 Tax=Capsicum annuum TaxID=4072 RepID=A0A2G2XWN7_CAPAN|nr:hypothetical protein T459_34237 [Capsicum annuum]